MSGLGVGPQRLCPCPAFGRAGPPAETPAASVSKRNLLLCVPASARPPTTRLGGGCRCCSGRPLWLPHLPPQLPARRLPLGSAHPAEAAARSRAATRPALCRAEVQSSVPARSARINMNLGEFPRLQCKQSGQGPCFTSRRGQGWGRGVPAGPGEWGLGGPWAPGARFGPACRRSHADRPGPEAARRWPGRVAAEPWSPS